jgi:hypothetical protein
VLGDTGLPSFLPIVVESIADLRNPDLGVRPITDKIRVQSCPPVFHNQCLWRATARRPTTAQRPAEMLHPRKMGLSFTAVLLEHIEMPDPLSAPSWNTTEPPRSAQKAPYNLARWTAQ